MSVLVVDDEPLARRRLIRMLGKLEWIDRVDEAKDAIEAQLKIKKCCPDILLLDIQMPGGSGFDVLEQLASDPPAIVFVTAFDQYALRAFEANAVDYLTKPIDASRFSIAMDRAKLTASSHIQTDRISELQEMIASLKGTLRTQSRQTAEFWVKSLGEFIRVTQDNIIRFQAERDYVRIHVSGTSYLYQETLTSLEQRLDSDEFIRIHRSNIVKRTAIAKIRKAPFSELIIVLSDGSEVRVGRTYSKNMRVTLK
ncbi:LytTR family DNA-binding domain-containing protein [Methylotenera sp.]|uniref:LytR/AlgR family response regulator transcription factor n=1 Tax=Methylotenera sp. TaxID=2051956 RepID=UPI0027311840|nr:LytTR family DNA-binding domain-containing protein [Methylotenera sp.]MDP2070022.1 LytTR family DNA-binding domain-containing protein [Methylotenera sp.]MDP3005006.1 LytTR family DNA-binding domain-containing protein [Methylotenera sp.]